MSTVALPKGWYSVVGENIAHHTRNVIGAAVRPLCRVDETPGGHTRPTEPGDGLCNQCLQALAAVGAAANLPMPQCLGCSLLRPAGSNGLIAVHAEPRSEDECPGWGVQGAAHDGRDDVRREAVQARATLNAEIADRIKGLGDSLGTWTMGDVADFHIEPAMRLESTRSLWDTLIRNGCYLETMTCAILDAIERNDGYTSITTVIRRSRSEGARNWLVAVRPKILALLQPGVDTDDAAARQLKEILIRL